MNKETIYIEPENDITDILAKLKNSEQKVVALVPPKKAGVLRSAVNIKLIAKTARDNEKAAVLVTTDPALIKLAAAAKIPVAKTLQSRPEVPTDEDVAALMASEQVIDDMSDQPENDDKDVKDGKDGKDAEKPADKSSKTDKKPEDKSKDDDKTEDKSSKKSDKKGKDGKKVPDIKKYRKLIIIGSILFVAIIGFLIWALAIAPKVDIKVSVQTEGQSFNETVTFTQNESEKNISEGKFFVEEQKQEQKQSVNFEATGKKDVGNKASGSLKVYIYLKEAGSVSIPAGASFSYGGLTYYASTASSLSWDGNDSNCDSGSSISSGCRVSNNISITAAEPGDKYNVGAQGSGWSSNVGGVQVESGGSISGGTSDVKTIVTQADIDKAKSGIESKDEEQIKSEFLKSFSDNLYPIDSSFNISVSDASSSPAVNEECSGNATLTVTTTVSMLAVDKGDIEQFIRDKIELPGDREIYSIGNPRFDQFVKGDTGMAAKLKTTLQIGPKITNEEVMEKAKGRKIGEVQSMLKSITGVTDVKIDGNFFWVRSVPDDPNRVNIELTNSSDNNTEEEK
ncbi:hypothetical protein IJI91_00065 [Candidatus Saccharibacteria bacterium]|nr:hypothetical protein [Candidatus Saccharibacteria bacterium]